MPYINLESRKEYDGLINDLAMTLEDLPNDKLAGHLNYVFFRLAGTLCTVDESYARMATVSSALGEAQAEFRRRILAPYEDRKIEENGDVEL